MKIREVVVSFLIVEILGSTIAQNQTPGILENAMDSIATSGQLQFQPLTKTKCERNGDPTAYEDSKFENSASVFLKCVHTLVNLTEFEAEMADARPENKQDAVIDKYCLRVSTFQQCMKNITDFISPCLEPQERTSVDILFGVTKSLLKFACNDGKKQIEDFITAGGSRCVASKYPAVQDCSSRSFPNFGAVIVPGLGLLPNLSLNISGCNHIEEYRRCSIRNLEECDNSTVARVVDGLFEFIKVETSCKELLDIVPGRDTELNDLEMELLKKADTSPEIIKCRK